MAATESPYTAQKQTEAITAHVLWMTTGLSCEGDGRLLGIAFANLLGNSWKFTARRPHPRIEDRKSVV